MTCTSLREFKWGWEGQGLRAPPARRGPRDLGPSLSPPLWPTALTRTLAPHNTRARTTNAPVLRSREAGHELAYSIEVKDNLGLSVSAALLPAAGGEEVVLVPEAKHKGGRVAVALPVPAPGTVRLRLSNAHSIFSGKSVTVTAAVEGRPAELEAGGGGSGAAAAPGEAPGQ